MPKKSFKRKKAVRQAACEQHKKGLLNDSDGSWAPSGRFKASIYQMSMSGALHHKV